ncbi:hypothetical protein [Sphingomonas sp.]|uniref:hypothetical protein n=1 Tax=Sphingomonas sp. TaxID=28214 RepID=UPI0031E0DC93
MMPYAMRSIARILAVTLGTYAVTALWTAAVSRLLVRTGVPPVEAVLAATLPSFALFAVITMSAFHARSVARAWMHLLAAAAIPALLFLV